MSLQQSQHLVRVFGMEPMCQQGYYALRMGRLLPLLPFHRRGQQLVDMRHSSRKC